MTSLHTYEKSALVTKLLEIRHNKDNKKLDEKDVKEAVHAVMPVESTESQYADALAYTKDALTTFNCLK
jgi:hypothetical protein